MASPRPWYKSHISRRREHVSHFTAPYNTVYLERPTTTSERVPDPRTHKRQPANQTIGTSYRTLV